MEQQRLDVKRKIDDIRKMYADKTGEGMYFSALIMGLFGSGKTRMIGTGRKPILIDSFDPRGTITLHSVFPDEVRRGEIIIRSFWDERHKRPTEYVKWEKQWESDIKSGFISEFGTYAIDSLTTFLDALANRVGQREGRPEGKLAIQDYVPIYNTLKDIIKISSAQDCDFFLTAHLVTEQDEVTGRVKAEIDTYKRLKSQIPILFTEKYVMTTKDSSKGTIYKLLTQPFREFSASTQLGAGDKFSREEDPDIKKLLKKAGMSCNDKKVDWLSEKDD